MLALSSRIEKWQGNLPPSAFDLDAEIVGVMSTRVAKRIADREMHRLDREIPRLLYQLLEDRGYLAVRPQSGHYVSAGRARQAPSPSVARPSFATKDSTEMRG